MKIEISNAIIGVVIFATFGTLVVNSLILTNIKTLHPICWMEDKSPEELQQDILESRAKFENAVLKETGHPCGEWLDENNKTQYTECIYQWWYNSTKQVCDGQDEVESSITFGEPTITIIPEYPDGYDYLVMKSGVTLKCKYSFCERLVR